MLVPEDLNFFPFGLFSLTHLCSGERTRAGPDLPVSGTLGISMVR